MGEGLLYIKWLDETVDNVAEMVARTGVEGAMFAFETWLRSYGLIDIKKEEEFNDAMRTKMPNNGV